jgi:hypothetical protein
LGRGDDAVLVDPEAVAAKGVSKVLSLVLVVRADASVVESEEPLEDPEGTADRVPVGPVDDVEEGSRRAAPDAGLAFWLGSGDEALVLEGGLDVCPLDGGAEAT